MPVNGIVITDIYKYGKVANEVSEIYLTYINSPTRHNIDTPNEKKIKALNKTAYKCLLPSSSSSK